MKALGDTPSSRDGHACTKLGEEMIIHGGFSADVRTLLLPPFLLSLSLFLFLFLSSLFNLPSLSPSPSLPLTF